MIAVLSPAKQMLPAVRESLPVSQPVFLQQAGILQKELSRFSPWELEALLKINPELAMKAYTNYQNFSLENTGPPAILSYHGLSYQHLHSQDLSDESLLFADRRLRILSAFYGLLRPLDSLQPYRLEFLCRFKPDQKSLYAFWGDLVARQLSQTTDTVINLASAEYAKLLLPYRYLIPRLITCEFLLPRRGKLIALATEAKMARGEMARFIIQNKVSKPELLRGFSWNGYLFQKNLSTGQRYVYVKCEP